MYKSVSYYAGGHLDSSSKYAFKDIMLLIKLFDLSLAKKYILLNCNHKNILLIMSSHSVSVVIFVTGIPLSQRSRQEL